MGLTQKLGTIPLAIFTDASNNIGIGGSPSGSFKFEVTGASRFWDGTQGLNVRAYTGGAGFGAIYSTGVTPGAGNFALAASSTATILSGVDNVSMAINSATKLYINNAGNVGINTTSPAQILQTETATGTNNIHLFSLSGATRGFIGVAGIANSILNEAAVGDVVIRSQLGKILLGTFQSGGSDAFAALTIANNRNVGIGTSSPISILDIFQTGQPQVRVRGTAGANHLYQDSITGSGNGDGLFVGIGSDQIGYIYHYENQPMVFATNNTERMRISSDGYLKVKGGETGYINANLYHELRTGAGDQWTAIFSNTAASPYCLNLRFPNSSPNSSVNFFLECTDSVTNRLRIAANGNVTNTNGSYGTISSDRRLKENIVSATPKLDDIMKLNVVNFNLIGNEEKHIGFIAQEMQEVFPSFVYQTDTRKYDEEGNVISGLEDALGVKTGLEFAILVKALQEANTKIEELSAKVSALENKS